MPVTARPKSAPAQPRTPSVIARAASALTAPWRSSTSAGTPSELASLTERELEVLTHVAAGRTNTEIATLLFLSEATIKTHLHHLLQKLGIPNRRELGALIHAAMSTTFPRLRA